ncbi:MAG: hypothetical protein LBR54_00515 [Oscillospiraceae bacterium]|nr:hypothetical protein [Oscillospiraceae bacterium]
MATVVLSTLTPVLGNCYITCKTDDEVVFLSASNENPGTYKAVLKSASDTALTVDKTVNGGEMILIIDVYRSLKNCIEMIDALPAQLAAMKS